MLHRPYQRLKGEMTEKNITYSDMARLLNISAATVSNKINGISDFRISEVQKIQTYYGIDYSFFVQ